MVHGVVFIIIFFPLLNFEGMLVIVFMEEFYTWDYQGQESQSSAFLHSTTAINTSLAVTVSILLLESFHCFCAFNVTYFNGEVRCQKSGT